MGANLQTQKKRGKHAVRGQKEGRYAIAPFFQTCWIPACIVTCQRPHTQLPNRADHNQYKNTRQGWPLDPATSRTHANKGDEAKPSLSKTTTPRPQIGRRNASADQLITYVRTKNKTTGSVSLQPPKLKFPLLIPLGV